MHAHVHTHTSLYVGSDN